ncbi:MAG: thiamine diphosphokinase [Ignavibacteria bacterium]|jgi:thiamine pyrophosphokinase|nr:thiamine diphosphokinase [Ignavibacteria bacterium]
MFNECDCIIVLNGTLDEPNVLEHFAGIPIIAADGAATKLTSIGITPDIIVGDMDSIVGNIENCEVIKVSEQDTNDFEKCLRYAISCGHKSCFILGINGGQYEHSLNNFSVAAKFGSKIKMCIYTDGRMGFFVYESIRIKLKIGEIVSLIPAPKAEVSSKNLQWELSHYELILGKKEGARNRAIAEEVELTLHCGCYFLFIDAIFTPNNLSQQ